jgi:succinoglycan biosynthesis protein ExoH
MFPSRFSATPALVPNLDAARFLLIAMVVLNHGFLLTPTSEIEGSPLERALVTLTRTAVPSLSVFSGLLFASAPATVVQILRQKARSLVLPFLVWNTMPVLVIFLYLWAFVPDQFALYSNYDLINQLTAFHDAPTNSPLYFLRDLVVVFLLAVLIRPLLAHPLFLAAAIGVAALNYLMDLDNRIFIRDTIPLFFLLGMALHSLLPRIPAWVAPLSAGAFFLCVIVWASTQLSWAEPSLFELVTMLAAALAILSYAVHLRPAARLARLGRSTSFVTFLAHWWPLSILYLLWQRLDGAFPDLVFEIGAPIVVLVLTTTIAPYVPAWASGGRTRPFRPAEPALPTATCRVGMAGHTAIPTDSRTDCAGHAGSAAGKPD